MIRAGQGRAFAANNCELQAVERYTNRTIPHPITFIILLDEKDFGLFKKVGNSHLYLSKREKNQPIIIYSPG